LLVLSPYYPSTQAATHLFPAKNPALQVVHPFPSTQELHSELQRTQVEEFKYEPVAHEVAH